MILSSGTGETKVPLLLRSFNQKVDIHIHMSNDVTLRNIVISDARKEIILEKRTISQWVVALSLNSFVFTFYNIEESQEIILLDEDPTEHIRKILNRSISGLVLKEREKNYNSFQ